MHDNFVGLPMVLPEAVTCQGIRELAKVQTGGGPVTGGWRPAPYALPFTTGARRTAPARTPPIPTATNR